MIMVRSMIMVTLIFKYDINIILVISMIDFSNGEICALGTRN